MVRRMGPTIVGLIACGPYSSYVGPIPVVSILTMGEQEMWALFCVGLSSCGPYS